MGPSEPCLDRYPTKNQHFEKDPERGQNEHQPVNQNAHPKDPVVHLRIEVGILKPEQMARVVRLFEVAEDARRFPHMDGGLTVGTIVDQSGHLGCVKVRTFRVRKASKQARKAETRLERVHSQLGLI